MGTNQSDTEGLLTATIVIPVYDRLDLTWACLEALYDATDEYELIVVDNGSSEDVRNLDGPDILIRNHNNRGFAVACNQGAALGSGDVVVFLNNDTEPREGWLKPLLDALKGPNVAVVGPTLVYPDGRLQHAGIDTRGSGASFEAYNVQEPRLFGDVKAVTGACLAVKRDVFAELGCFDEGFVNGYEDVDFCLRARDAGYRVVYTPDSVVMHHESASGPARWSHVRENVARLQKRWG
jgi:GT2 family glycosyltransferase